MHPVTARALYLTGRPGRLAKSPQRGLTLIELVVAIAVLVILVTWAIPGFQSFTARNEVVAEVLRIKTALALARNTAVTRRTTISVCASPGPAYDTCAFDDWNHDWVIVEGEVTGGSLAGDTILRVLEASDQVEVSFNRDDRPVRFSAVGWSRGHNGTFILCRNDEENTSIIISNRGKVRVEPIDITSC